MLSPTNLDCAGETEEACRKASRLRDSHMAPPFLGQPFRCASSRFPPSAPQQCSGRSYVYLSFASRQGRSRNIGRHTNPFIDPPFIAFATAQDLHGCNARRYGLLSSVATFIESASHRINHTSIIVPHRVLAFKSCRHEKIDEDTINDVVDLVEASKNSFGRAVQYPLGWKNLRPSA